MFHTLDRRNILQLSNDYFNTHDSPKVPKQYVTHCVNAREAALITDIAKKKS